MKKALIAGFTGQDGSYLTENVNDDRRMAPVVWPQKYDLFGVKVSSTTYASAVDLLVRAGKAGRSGVVDFTPVSVLVEGVRNPVFRSQLNSFDLICPDGQPVKWCLNHFHGLGLSDRVCGTTTMLRLCAAAAAEGLGVYLYGSTEETLALLGRQLLGLFPNLKIAGAEAPPFRPLNSDEEALAIERINASGAAFVFLGIGSPKQELFAWRHRSRISAIQLCVGAAFDFIAGTKTRAPQWMQQLGLEWLHRLLSEPRRLGLRYLIGNARFIALLLTAMARAPKARLT